MAAHWKSDRRRRMIVSGPDFVNVRRTLRPTTRCAMWLPTFLQRGIHFFGERTEVLAFNNLILFDRIQSAYHRKARGRGRGESSLTFALSRHASPRGAFCFAH